ncbi:hypothetical protein FNV43_RR09476 [Rhamnella rubrinervis]|uniref:Pentatricopeptide repeat-containing protein n=1 Tax=Rhamnella rubrinervis TaxID=2594499 RepID=A0A8K0MK92_9ROSA|nr:hypothetical protein FNV43_RR09476 [Rhamnella rubrinervis]
MKNFSVIANVCSARLRLAFGRTFRYYSFETSAVLSISQEDASAIFEDSISDGDCILSSAKSNLAEYEEQDEFSFGGKDVAEVVNKDLLFFSNQKTEDCKMKRIIAILTNLGWNFTSSNGCRIDMNQSNIIRIINDLYKESLDATLALYFFNWAMDMMLHLVRNYGENESCNLLLKVYNKLLRELVRSKQKNLAWELSEVMETRGLSLNASIVSLFIHDYCSEATSLLFKMTQFGISPDSVLLSSIIDGLCKVGEIEKAINILKFFNLPLNIFVYNSFISKSCTDGNMVKASRLFHEMSELGMLPDCFSYTTIIGGYCKMGDMKKAFQYFGKMLKVGTKPSVITFTLLIKACCKSGNMEMAESLLQKMMTGGLLPDVVAYNTLMDGYGKKGHLLKVYEVLDRMKSSNICPDVVTYNTLIHSIIKRGFIDKAKDILDELIKTGAHQEKTELTKRGFSPDVVTFTNVIDGFSRQGDAAKALLVWFRMCEHNVKPDVIACSAILNAYCRECRMEEAHLCSMRDMDKACNLVSMMIEHGILPNNITHRGLVLGFEKKWVKNPPISAAFKLQEILLRYGIGFDIDKYLAMVEQRGRSETTFVSEHSLANCCRVV